MEKEIILLAGGTGLVGKKMSSFFQEKGHEVRILSRRPSAPQENRFHWNPAGKQIDVSALRNVTVIINLAGAGITDKRWTESRKKELISSRRDPALFLASLAPRMASLKQYISASGVNCYGYEHPEKIYEETDLFGTDFLSQVVKKWEESADMFSPFCKVAKIRISMVLTENGGALETIAKPIRFGIGSPLGSGKQWMPWIHWKDLVRIFDFVLENNLDGSFNALSGVADNRQFTRTLTPLLGKRLWAPGVPAFLLKLLLGEMSTVALQGVNASGKKLKELGFIYEYGQLDNALEDLVSTDRK